MGLTSCLLATVAGAVMVQAQTQYGSSPPVYPSRMSPLNNQHVPSCWAHRA